MHVNINMCRICFILAFSALLQNLSQILYIIYIYSAFFITNFENIIFWTFLIKYIIHLIDWLYCKCKTTDGYMCGDGV